MLNLRHIHNNSKRKAVSVFLLFFLTCSAFLRAQAPVAQFTSDVTAGCTPIIVRFTDQSTNNPTSWLWDFGNGITSPLANPTATYFNPGTYTVTLTVTNASGSNTISKTNYITVNAKPTVIFTSNDSVGCFPFRVQFSDLSTPGSGSNTEWLWDFGDGANSTLQNPSHTYATAGNYTVTLKVTNSNNCFNVASKVQYIQIADGVTANFTNSISTTCNPPALINFTNATTGPGTLTYQWFFGDGGNSLLTNPSHTYAANGTYTVTLIATSSGGCIDTLVRNNAIVLQAVTNAFNGPDSVCTGIPAVFQNTTTPLPPAAAWSFGDGGTGTSNTVSHVYITPGTYPVKLVNQYANCSDSITKNIRVLARSTAAFSGTNTVGCRPPLTVNFTSTTTNAAAWQWNFGDGGISTLQNPSHTYTAFGNYDVTLIVTNTSGCKDTLRLLQYVRIAAPVLAISNMPARGCLPFAFTPAALITTVDGIASYFWDFGDGFTSTLPNPSHTYTVQGTYNFKLRITTIGGCTDSVVYVGGVRAGNQPGIPDFSATPIPVCAFQPVQFTDLSTGPVDEWNWDFNDGGTDILQNPQHIYQDTGTFTVRLTISNSGCDRSVTKVGYIQVLPPIAQFRDSTGCGAKLTKYFINESIGGVTYSWNFGDGFTSTAANPIHTYAATGTYTVSLTAVNGTCSHTRTRQVPVIIEAPNFSSSSTTVCRRSSVSFTAAGVAAANISSYSWNFGDGGTASGPVAAHTYNQAGNFTVKLYTTDLNGCVDSVVKTNYMRINGATANFGSVTNSGCSNQLVTFIDSTITDGVNAIVEWKWDFGDNIIQTFSNPPFTHSYGAPGTYDVKLVVTDAAGCKDSISFPDFVRLSNPVARFYSPDTLTCPGSSVTFIDTSLSSTILKFWDFGNGVTSTQTSVTVSTVYFTPGFYTVKLKLTDGFGCMDSAVKVSYIRVDTPNAQFAMSDSIASCPPLNVQFTFQGSYQQSVNWDFGTGSISTLLNPAHLYSIPGTYFPRLIVTSPGGCRDTAVRRVFLSGPFGTVNYSPLAGCKPLTVNFQATTNGASNSILWDFGNGFTQSTTDSNLVYTYPTGGRFTPRLILGDPAGCLVPVIGADTILVEDLKAKFAAVNSRFVCDSGQVQFADSSTRFGPIASYFWDFGDGGTSTAVNPVHNYTAPGLYTVKLVIRSALGCVDSTVQVNYIQVDATPQVNIFGDTTSCAPGNFLLQAIIAAGDTSTVRWQWRFDTGQTPTTQTVSISYPNPGSYGVSLIGTTLNGCVDSVRRNIIVHPLPATNAGPDTAMCFGTPIQLQATGAFSYFWLPPADATLSCNVCLNPLANPTRDTMYVVRGRTIFGCLANDTVFVKVRQPYTTTLLPANPVICLNKSVQLEARGGDRFVWSPATGLSNPNIAKPLASPVATTTYTVTATDSLNCFNQNASITVTVLPLPTINAGPDQTIAAGGSAALNTISTGGALNYLWRPISGLSCSNCPSPVAAPQATTSYVVRVTNGGGCLAEDTVTVFVVCDNNNFFIPNTFSPNGDGINDVFYPRGKGIERIKSMIIFNRWGERVFEKREFAINDPTQGWNGRNSTVNGSKLNADVYTYFIEIICSNNLIIPFKGNVTLIQ
jgi:gliding motility-associated-like protein